MGQCISNPGNDEQNSKARAPCLSNLGSRRRSRHSARRTTKSAKQPGRDKRAERRVSRRSPPNNRPSTSSPQQDVQASTQHYSAVQRNREGSSVITEIEESREIPAQSHSEMPQPQRIQEIQESQEQTDGPLPDPQGSQEYPTEHSPDGIPEEFRQQLSELLEGKLVEKDHKLDDFLKKKKNDGRGKQQKHWVQGESLEVQAMLPKQMADPNVEAPHEPSLKPGQSLFSFQEIDHSLLENSGVKGRGRFGSVLVAQWHGATVAVKVFHSHSSAEENARAVLQEANALAILAHPGVIGLYGLRVGGDHPGLVLEYVSDGSLKQQLRRIKRRKGPVAGMTTRTKTLIALQAANAMAYFHSQGVTHYDVKAESFLCDLRNPDRPIVKMASAGLSKYDVALYVTSNMMGTLPWMAPELLPRIELKDNPTKPHTEREVNLKVDVYSFGIFLWEIWTLGDDVYSGMTDVFVRILGGDLRPPVPEDCPPDWVHLMELCWDENPDARPEFADVCYRLEDILSTCQ